MMYPVIRKLAAIAFFTCIVGASMAQDPGPKNKLSTERKESKPFRILTNGKQITVQSNRNISKIIVWTSGGNRFVEQSNVEASSYNFTIPAKEKFVFMMLELEGGKRFTEKIGIQQ
ncbi:MAG TPA: hypothetical protein VGQ53_12505 [Chitinophagaceae bacterium]|jgi:hypothetical protein|nr:hypothetical protein [Chitinophagaceae bacterium]